MHIRRSIPTDRDALVDIWLRSVRATHSFLTEDDIQSFLPLVREHLASGDLELWVLCSESGAPLGFMGMSGSKMEALFLDPAIHRRGGGRQMVRHAQHLRGELTVDVNEQNPGCCRFYEACGFVVEGRSEVDSAGRPFPLLHMRLPAPERPPADGPG
jgi:putative acetyltransferase